MLNSFSKPHLDVFSKNPANATQPFIFVTQEEVEPLQQVTKGGTMQDMEDALAAKTQAVEELSRELGEIRAAFGTEGVQQVNVLLLYYT